LIASFIALTISVLPALGVSRPQEARAFVPARIQPKPGTSVNKALVVRSSSALILLAYRICGHRFTVAKHVLVHVGVQKTAQTILVTIS
jgi:hypothetical protein